jgi:hypothetical protein
MGTAVGAMYLYLENGLSNDYLVVSFLMLSGMVGLMWLGRNL